MKYIFSILVALLLSSSAFADGHSEPQYSKSQSNYYVTCHQPAACVGAFQKMLAAPDIADKGFEAILYALGHNGWDDSTHMVSFYFKNAERCLETFYLTPVFKAYSAETEGAVSLVRSHIANTLYEANPD